MAAATRHRHISHTQGGQLSNGRGGHASSSFGMLLSGMRLMRILLTYNAHRSSQIGMWRMQFSNIRMHGRFLHLTSEFPVSIDSCIYGRTIVVLNWKKRNTVTEISFLVASESRFSLSNINFSYLMISNHSHKTGRQFARTCLFQNAWIKIGKSLIPTHNWCNFDSSNIFSDST